MKMSENHDDSTLPPSSSSSPEKSASIASRVNSSRIKRSHTQSNSKGQNVKRIGGSKNQAAVNVPPDAFVSIRAESGEYRSKFRILPYTRASNSGYSGSSDKLADCIRRGGGVVVSDKEYLSPSKSRDVIKILDVEYVRANIRETQDMILPYDCFSSSFIWNQIYQRINCGPEKVNADLNLYRVSPSALVDHDANGIFQGAITWDDIQPIQSDKLSPAIRIKEVALQMFPELIVCAGAERSNLKTRRVYTRHDSQMLLDKICEIDAHDRVLGILLYKELASTYFPERTCLSLKEHFCKTILPHVLANDGYYKISQEDCEKFNMMVNEEKRMELRSRKKRARLVEDTEDEEEDI